MSPSKKPHFLNLPKRQSPRLKSLYSNSTSNSSSSSFEIKSEPSDCDEGTSSFTSKQNYSSDDCEEISLNDLRAKCKARKRRKNRELESWKVKDGELESWKVKDWELESWKVKDGELESDLDEPLIVLKVKRAKVRNKGVHIISQCVDSAISQTGLSDENFPIQADYSTTSLPNNGTSSDTCTSDLIHQVKTESLDRIEISDTSIDSSNLTCIVKTEILEKEWDQIEILEKERDQIEILDKEGDQIEILEKEGDQIEILEKEGDQIEILEKEGDQIESLEKEVDQIEISPSMVDFIAKFDSSSPDKSSYLIFPANENAPCGETLTCALNMSCNDYSESEEQFYLPEIPQNESCESEIEKSSDVISENSKVDCANLTEIVEKEKNTDAISETSKVDCVNLTEIVEKEKNTDVISGNSKVDCSNLTEIVEKEKNTDVRSENSKVDRENLTDGCTEEKGVTDHGFLCEEAPDFLDISSFGSTDGQLESIVYNAINAPNCSQNTKKNDDDYNNEVISNSDQVSVLKSVKVLETKGLQFCDNREKEKSEAINENGGAEVQNVDEQITRQESTPIKLLSNRNIISPTSQEKLCQALTGIDICEGAGFSKCKKKILFENWTKAKKPPCESTSQSTPTRSFNKLRGVIAKKTSRNNSPLKMDSQKAVEFSQRQMQDFESIANKLLKSMKFMKNVLDESLDVDSPPLLSKFSFNEIKAASENASELDRMTRKWLTIMSKDCNRFCKILKSAGDMSSPVRVNNNNEPQNKRRKIVFADEAGGVLCDIRFFSQPEPEL